MLAQSVRTAYHEAGHVLAAVFLGRSVESVAIGPGGGAVRQEPLSAEATDEEIKHGLVVVFAGAEAERYAPPQERRADDDPWFTPQEEALLDAEPVVLDAPSDEAVIDHFTKRLGPEEVEDARAFAAEIVERQFLVGRLEQLADELLWRTSLSGEDIQRLLGARA